MCHSAWHLLRKCRGGRVLCKMFADSSNKQCHSDAERRLLWTMMKISPFGRNDMGGWSKHKFDA